MAEFSASEYVNGFEGTMSITEDCPFAEEDGLFEVDLWSFIGIYLLVDGNAETELFWLGAEVACLLTETNEGWVAR